MQHLDELLARAERITDPATRELLQETASALLELHGLAFQNVLDRLGETDGAGAKLLDVLLRDHTVSAVLILHALHPIDMETRVRAALKRVEPYAVSHGGHIELLSVTPDGVVNLRLDGSCHGCPSSRVTLRSSIEQEIFAAAPDVTEIIADGVADEAESQSASVSVGGFVPLEHLAIHGAPTRVAATAH
jgi:Fe-S cluster biogenesis protein NfuA